MNKRHTDLIMLVSRYGKVEVSKLAELLNTSQVTIRKDLEMLTHKGILRRERGFALLKNLDDINYRMAFHYDAKQKIARAAAEMVADGETLLIESGSTCAMFAEELAIGKKEITIITNSAYIANFIKDHTNVSIILLGGNYQKHTQAAVGPMTKKCVQEFHVDKLFIGIDGFSRASGFTGNNLVRADTLTAMTKAASHTIILTESEKFLQPGTISFLQPANVYKVITDENIPAEIKNYLLSEHIKVQTV